MTEHIFISETIDKLPCVEHLKNYPKPKTSPDCVGNKARVSWRCGNCGVSCITTYKVSTGTQRDPGNYWQFDHNDYQ